MSSIRLHKINELLRREISDIIHSEVEDPKVGFVTITNVDVTKDLKYATVRISVLGKDKKKQSTINCLNNAAGFIQHILSTRIRLRSMPKVIFKLDTTIDHSLRVQQLLEEIHNKQKSDDRNDQEQKS